MSADGLVMIGLSGLGAGSVAVGATLAIERLGGRLGGVIGTLPTTIIPASWGMWVALTPSGDPIDPHALEGFARSMYAVPVGMGLNAIFLWLWRVLPDLLISRDLRSHALSASSHDLSDPESELESALESARESERETPTETPTETISAFARLAPPTPDSPDAPPIEQLKLVSILSGFTLSVWLLSALLWVWVAQRWIVSVEARALTALIATFVMVALGLIVTSTHVPAPRGRRAVSRRTLLMRGLAAGLAVAGAVALSKSGAPTLAGVASVFPAIFWTTMVSLWLSQGSAVPTGAVGPMMLGSSSVSLFAILAPTLYPMWGAGLGALGAWLIAALGASTPSYLWLRRRARHADTA